MDLMRKIELQCDYISLDINWINYKKLNLDDRSDRLSQDINNLQNLLPEYQYIGIFHHMAIFTLKPIINEA